MLGTCWVESLEGRHTKRKTIKLLGFALLAMPAAALFANGIWIFSGDIFYEATSKGKHPRTASATLAVTEEMGESLVCVEYENTSSKANRGKVDATLLFAFADGSETAAESPMTVRGNGAIDCFEIDFLEPGDVVFASFEFRKFARLKRGQGFVGSVLTFERSALEGSQADLSTQQRQLVGRYAEAATRARARIARVR